MVSAGNNLRHLLGRTRTQRRLLLGLRGLALCLCTGATILLATGWAAHYYRQTEGVIFWLRLAAVILFLATIYLALVRPLWRRISDARLARLIEEHTPGTEDRLVAAVECWQEPKIRVSAALVNRLYADADDLAATLSLKNVVRRDRLLMYPAAALASLLFVVGVLKWGPKEVSEGVAQLVTPSTFAASSSSLSIKVKPGTARVPKGSDQEILATLVNFDSQAVTVFSRPAGSKADWQSQQMEPAKARADFRHSIFNIQDSVEYYVESNSVRSGVFKLTVVDLPFVKQLDLLLTFPAFAQLPEKNIEDGGDIAALKGTTATITARLTGKVQAARIVFPDGGKSEMKAQGTDFVGEIWVSTDTSYYIELVSVDGETYRGSNEYDIAVLEDQPPTISFERPGRDKKATNLEEVFTQARAEDDYGVVSIELYFSVNGAEEKNLKLQQLDRESARKLTATHTFFLEEFGLKPGDFISYYAKARDANHEVTSDIYFIEIKPFEMQYRQSQQQSGQAGGQGEDQDQNALSRRQKDLIAATHRLIRESEKYTAQERKDGYEAVAAGQEKLRADTLEFLDRLGRRLGGQMEGQKELSEMAENLQQAAREMEGAPPPLRREAGREALPPEQRALQRLLAADAIFREVQVAFGNQSSGSSGSSQNQQQELAGLFELELDKMKNQYETVQRSQRQQAQQAKSEAERKLEELAQRQQRALEEQRRRQQGPLNNSGGAGNQRQQQELLEETRRAARELERLSRQRRDPRIEQLSRQLNQSADEMQRAQASSRSNPNESIQQNERALERLRETQRRLQQMNNQPGSPAGQSGREQEISELRQRAAQAAARQRAITREVENLARRGGQSSPEAGRQAREQLAERKDALADAVNGLQQDLEQSARGLQSAQQRTARQLNQAAGSLTRNRVAERIREGKQALDNNQLETARANERNIERSLNELAEQLQSAEQSARRANSVGAEEALDRTRQLADDLDSLRRRLEDSNARGNNQTEQQTGERGQNSQNQGRDSGQSQGGEQQSGSQRGSEAGSSGDNRQLGTELRERLQEAERLRREWGVSGDPGRTLADVVEELRRFADGRMEGNAQTAAALKANVVEPLRQLELDLSRQLNQTSGRSTLRLRNEGTAPERYRKAVEQYYRRLSTGRSN